MVPRRAVGGVPLPRARHRHAARGIGALIIGFRELPAESASHVDDKALLGFHLLILGTRMTQNSSIGTQRRGNTSAKPDVWHQVSECDLAGRSKKTGTKPEST